MFDTHCHLNFKRFEDNLTQVISDAYTAGVSHILVPGTDVATSQKAVEIAEKYETIYAAVGIHPHHVYEFGVRGSQFVDDLKIIEELLLSKKVVAVGEAGMDKHPYKNTKYKNYTVTDEFLNSQKELLEKQVKLAIKYGKSLILHNREAKEDLLPIVHNMWDDKLQGKAVFHCCEPDEELLSFAVEHQIYIGVDGDITYTPAKQKFVKKIPVELLVLETDAPFLLPEPLRSEKKFPNEPKNIILIAEYIASLLSISPQTLGEVTMENSKCLFGLA